MILGVEITADSILTMLYIITALIAIFGSIFAAYRWYLKQEKQDKDIEKIKRENTLICESLMACLDGLEQLGANHTVPAAKVKLENYLNNAAHDLEDK